MPSWSKDDRASDQVSHAGAALNLSSRAAAAARAELRGDRSGILGAIGEAVPIPLGRMRTVPDRWSFIFVMERLDENLKLQARRHADNTATLRELAEKLDQHAAAVAMIRPTVAALELSRSKLATWASIGLTAVVILGWIVEAAVKWTVGAVLAHFQ
jgi:hypothetical protein